jgi:WD40 repeat protein
MLTSDRSGPPLPPGCVARLGCRSFRNGGFVHHLDFALGDRAIATFHQNLVRVWDLPDGNQRCAIEAPRSLYVLAVAPDGRTAAGGTLDIGEVFLFDLATGVQTRRVQAHRESISALAFGPDSGSLVTASGSDETDDATIRVWDLKANKKKALDWRTAVQALALSPDGQTLASLSNSLLCIWDLHRGALLDQREVEGLVALAYSPDGRALACSCRDGTIGLQDARSGQWTWREPAHRGLVRAVAFTPDGSQLASAGADRVLRICATATGREELRLDGLPEAPDCLRFSRDGRWLAWGGYDSRVHVWDRAAGRELAGPSGHEDIVFRVAFTRDGGRLITASRDGSARIWDVATARELHVLEGHQGFIRGLALSPDGTLLATGSNDTTVRLWDPQTGQPRAVLTGHAESVPTVAFSPDGRMLVSGGQDGTLRFWDPATGRLLRVQEAHPKARIEHVAFVGDGRVLVTNGQTYHTSDDTLRFWDVATGKEVRRLGEPLPTYEITGLSVSPDGRLLAWCCFGGGEGNAHVLDLRDGATPRQLEGYNSNAHGMAFSPDGQLLAGGDGPAARLWSAKNGQLLALVTGHDGDVEGLAFSPDGTRLATASSDTTVLVWDLPALLG